MARKEFNFNNEVDTFEIEVDEETGRVTIPGTGGALAEYESMQQFAEFYAEARDVKPENLKNWTLVENGSVVSFVLCAGTAGVSAASIEGQLQEVFDTLRREGAYHPLDVERVKQEVNGADDIMRALAMASVQEVARAVYDRLNESGAFAVEDEPEEEEPVDERSAIEVYLDTVLERDKTLAFFATLLNLPASAPKEEILTALAQSRIPYECDTLMRLYRDALGAAKENGINVETDFEALLVITQSVPGDADDEMKKRLLVSARIAGRNRVNITSYIVGNHHIKKTATLVPVDEMNRENVYADGRNPVLVTFDAAVDEELEEEHRLAETEEDYDDEYDDIYDDEYDEDGYDE